MLSHLFFNSILLAVVVAIHELGHATMAAAVGARVKAAGVSKKGIYVRIENPHNDLYSLGIHLGGPLASVLASFFFLQYPEFAFYNLFFGVMNLLPFHHSDGKQAWASFQNLKG